MRRWKSLPRGLEVTRNAATERPFTGPHLDNKRDGVLHLCLLWAEALIPARFDFRAGPPVLHRGRPRHERTAVELTPTSATV